jgi:3-oxoacyl-[acyl-carrier-protein] synthase III
MRIPDMYIGGLGKYLPETFSVERAVEEGFYSQADVELHEFTGAAVAGPVPAPEMGLRAAQEALERSGQHAKELDLVLYVSTWLQGPEGWLPHSYLQRHLVGGDVPAIEVRQGCNGVFGALDLAVSHLRADPARDSVLVVAADNFGTPLVNRWTMLPGYVVGDAGSAVLLTKQRGFAQLVSLCSITVPEAEQMHRGKEPLFPPGVALGRDVDFGARFRDLSDVINSEPESGLGAAFGVVRKRLVEVVERALEESRIEIDDVARLSFVNCTREALEQRCLIPLGIPLLKSTWEFGRTIGHCGASDQILALEHVTAARELHPGQHMLLLGTAPGITLSAAVIKLLDTPDWRR